MKKTYFCKFASGHYILSCEQWGFNPDGSRYMKKPMVDVTFVNHQLEVVDPEVQKLIESDACYGAEITVIGVEAPSKIVAPPTEPEAGPETPPSGPEYASGPMTISGGLKRGKPQKAKK